MLNVITVSVDRYIVSRLKHKLRIVTGLPAWEIESQKKSFGLVKINVAVGVIDLIDLF